MPGVQGTYIQFESAGDQYVGRTATGLPCNDAQFGIVGPFFSDADLVDRDLVDRFVNIVFPNIPQNCKLIGRWMLASLIYHRTFLLETFPPGHLILSLPVMSDPSISDLLLPLVLVKNVSYICNIDLGELPYTGNRYSSPCRFDQPDGTCSGFSEFDS
jgi:hypothetical protein